MNMDLNGMTQQDLNGMTQRELDGPRELEPCPSCGELKRPDAGCFMCYRIALHKEAMEAACCKHEATYRSNDGSLQLRLCDDGRCVLSSRSR